MTFITAVVEYWPEQEMGGGGGGWGGGGVGGWGGVTINVSISTEGSGTPTVRPKTGSRVSGCSKFIIVMTTYT